MCTFIISMIIITIIFIILVGRHFGSLDQFASGDMHLHLLDMNHFTLGEEVAAHNRSNQYDTVRFWRCEEEDAEYVPNGTIGIFFKTEQEHGWCTVTYSGLEYWVKSHNLISMGSWRFLYISQPGHAAHPHFASGEEVAAHNISNDFDEVRLWPDGQEPSLEVEYVPDGTEGIFVKFEQDDGWCMVTYKERNFWVKRHNLCAPAVSRAWAIGDHILRLAANPSQSSTMGSTE